jgi:hypothetical protein
MPEISSSVSTPSFYLGNLPVKGLAWCLCLAVSLTVFLAPALWNGFAIVFFDSGGYVGRVLEMTLGFGRSFFYGVFLWVTSLGWWSFFGPAAIQSLFAVWLIHLMLRCHELPAGPLATALICLGLGTFTSISWYTSQLMPDLLLPLMVLGLWLIAFCWEKLGQGERLGLALVILLGLLSHMSSMALAVGLICILLVTWLGKKGWGWRLPLTLGPPTAIVVASLVLMPLIHFLFLGKAGYTPGGPAFIFGRLVQDNIAQRWLAEHCPVDGVKLCALQDRLPNTGDDFLWNGSSPFMDIGGWSGAADGELSFLVRQCLKSYPGQTLWTALVATAEQMTMVATGDGLDDFHGAARGTFSNDLDPTVSQAFNAARQQQEQITQPLFDAMNRLHVPVALLSTIGLLVCSAWEFSKRRPHFACLAAFIFVALMGNAFICGALSGPHDRYQSRIVWLAPLVVVMAIIRWWRIWDQSLGSEISPGMHNPRSYGRSRWPEY